MTGHWKYRVHCVRGEELEALLNLAGEEGFEILHLNHRFLEGPEDAGAVFVVLGRRQEAVAGEEDITRLAARHLAR